MTDRISPLPAESMDNTPNALQAQFIKIADETKPKAKGADGPKTDVGDAIFNSVLSAKPTDFGEGVRDAQTAAKAFMAVPDKTQALAQGAPAFEAAIKQSDADYISAIAKYSPEYNQKRHDLEASQMPVVMGTMALKGVLTNLPEDKQEEAAQLVGLALDKNISAALRDSLFKEMEQFPGLRKNCEAVHTAIETEQTALQEMQKAAQPLLHAAYEEAATRYIYAHAMELGGDKAKGYLMKEEGQSKINDAYFEFLDEPKPPKPLQSV